MNGIFCAKCVEPLCQEWIDRGYKYCKDCTDEFREKNSFSQEIQSFFREDIREKRKGASSAYRSKPHKQPWGMHIIQPYVAKNNLAK